MILLIGTLRGGLVSMVPNLTPILLTLGLMGWLDYKLDFSTMMIGAIVLGVAVDDTIHFMHVFQRSYRTSGDPVEAVERTLQTTGRAILFTSIVLCVGFSGFTLASMKNLVNTGVLTCFAIAMAFLADVLLAPALMVLILRRRT
jgi:predicted RND superfamily exporter protein